ncbi:MAG TPA: hypothetical protein VMU22_07545 [Rhizomicrobium sp.]|nr:hypothetical protein [Rhizomicrobium sp.]
MKAPRLEELRIVFSLKPHVVAKQTLGDRTFDVLAGKGLDALAAFDTINHILGELRIPAEFRTYDGTLVPKTKVEERLSKKGKGIPYLNVGGLALRSGNITAMEQSFIIVEEKSEGAASSWDRWVTPFLGWPSFVQAWVTDVEYDHWQNAQDPIEYKTVGRSMVGLRMKSNGLPPPLEQQIVDTSENAGRWEFRPGYVEAIGSIMWFSENFWHLIGSDRKSALAKLNWLHLTEPQKGILRASSDIYFDDETTASEQDALRKAVYGS